MRLHYLLLYFLCFNFSFAQYIKGRVVDDLNQPLAAANVYYEGTTLSTFTNDNGDFILVYEPQLKRPIVVSYIGYVTTYVESYTISEHLTIKLTQDIGALREVVVKKDKFSRKEKMAIFKEHFLGKTAFGLKTIIENEDDIVLEYDEETFMLKAYANKPLVIVNPSLGYKINYELVDFEVQFSILSLNPHAIKRSYYAGYTRFEEIENSSRILKKREQAYRGSPMHFYRNLINGIWGKNDFQLFLRGHLTNPSNHFTVTKEADRYKVDIKRQKIDFENDNLVAFFGLLFDGNENSIVQFNAETIYVDPYGNNLSSRDVSFSGFIQFKRLGDTLPLNYGL
ncbi:carboxypeptidase-like regulatory domain-containing protein [Flavobacterium sp. IMCC34852]|uniref:Carboxypeptidase-like regulatory domain-containing protein n=1 Tax=Flavobacterium rivulicola TaxID=2732161 RepID=A0A7Y3RA88_9FLAO|nr:carboxypeptidase-like regulatory domain-containing protein [Flavobacterium sp. IMCC34852]NNT72385.1 carboxypeptidase-like regulatory domain-containing protein [Flavobacterium sp. IMCC34852]